MNATEPLYEIEAILEHRMGSYGKYEYFVKWKVCLWFILFCFFVTLDVTVQWIILIELFLWLLNKQDYPADQNTWEPSESFVSQELLNQYHESKGNSTDHLKSSKQVNENIPMCNDTPKTSRKVAMNGLLQDKMVNEYGLEPEKVLSINHFNENEMELVALIKFKNCNEPKFVRASWANRNCAQLVIKFYESRIFWREKG